MKYNLLITILLSFNNNLIAGNTKSKIQGPAKEGGKILAGALAGTAIQSQLPDKDKEVTKKVNVEQSKQLGEQSKQLGEKDKTISEQSKQLGEQSKQLGEKDKTISELSKQLGEKDKTISEQAKTISEQAKTISELINSNCSVM